MGLGAGQCVRCAVPGAMPGGAAKTARGASRKQIRLQGRYARPKCRAQKAPLIWAKEGGRFAEGSGKRRKIYLPRGRFGLIFGAKPI